MSQADGPSEEIKLSANRDLILAGVSAGGTSGLELLWVAPTGTTGPTDATSVLGAGWESAGYISTDGVTLGVDESSEDIGAYAASGPVRTLNTDSKQTLGVVFLETNPTVLEIYHRKDPGTILPDGSGNLSLTVGAIDTQTYSIVVDVVDGTNSIRYYYPSAEVSDRGELQIAKGSVIKYEVTFTAYPDSTTGIAMYQYAHIPELASS